MRKALQGRTEVDGEEPAASLGSVECGMKQVELPS